MLLTYAGADPHHDVDNDDDDEKEEKPALSTPSRGMMLPVLHPQGNEALLFLQMMKMTMFP